MIIIMMVMIIITLIIIITTSVNKYNEDFEHNEAPSEFSGHKWSLQTFWKYLEKEVIIIFIIIIFVIIIIIIRVTTQAESRPVSTTW